MINYVNGDATNPLGKGNKILMHVCNDLGKFGKGFALAVAKKWPHVRAAYLDWYNNRDSNDFELGAVQFVEAQPYLYIANMVGQKGIKSGSKGPPIRYDAVRMCLKIVKKKAQEIGASVHAPFIGTGLAGASPDMIKKILQEELGDIQTTIYLMQA